MKLKNVVLVGAFALSLSDAALAGSATWKTNPASGNWNTAANWMPASVPNGPSNIARFGTSNKTNVTVSADTEVNGIIFKSGASEFTITAAPAITLTISGTGITDHSYPPAFQEFASATNSNREFGRIVFTNGAVANKPNPPQAGIPFRNSGAMVGGASGGVTEFHDNSSAADGFYYAEGGVAKNAGGGQVNFFDNATTGQSADFIVKGPAVTGALPGSVNFYNNSNAGRSLFDVEGGAVSFFGNSGAGEADFILRGGGSGGNRGLIQFLDSSRGGTSLVGLQDNSQLDIQNHDAPGVTLGVIEGSGSILLGANELVVGRGKFDTKFSGLIQDGPGGPGGSLTKIGANNLVLANANTYTGGTVIREGVLLINNVQGSGTGTGPVRVKGGTLAGNGKIAGPVTIGTQSGGTGVLSPGSLFGFNQSGTGTLGMLDSITFNSNATYQTTLDSDKGRADRVAAMGVTIVSGAQIFFTDIGSSQIPVGTVFTIIKNTAAIAINGAFSNLPDNATFNSNGNIYRASYHGGDGNDLTLTVQ